jgi:hypothetical protein
LGPTWHYLYFTSFSELAAPKFLAKNHTTSKEMENRKKKRKTEETPSKKWKTFYTLDSGHIHKRTLSFVAGKEPPYNTGSPKIKQECKAVRFNC